MSLTTEQLDAYCGGAPTIRLTCPWCVRVVGPYYTVGNARLALQIHLAYIHFTSEIAYTSQEEASVKRTSRGKTVKRKLPRFRNVLTA